MNYFKTILDKPTEIKGNTNEESSNYNNILINLNSQLEEGAKLQELLSESKYMPESKHSASERRYSASERRYLASESKHSASERRYLEFNSEELERLKNKMKVLKELEKAYDYRDQFKQLKKTNDLRTHDIKKDKDKYFIDFVLKRIENCITKLSLSDNLSKDFIPIFKKLGDYTDLQNYLQYICESAMPITILNTDELKELFGLLIEQLNKLNYNYSKEEKGYTYGVDSVILLVELNTILEILEKKIETAELREKLRVSTNNFSKLIIETKITLSLDRLLSGNRLKLDDLIRFIYNFNKYKLSEQDLKDLSELLEKKTLVVSDLKKLLENNLLTVQDLDVIFKKRKKRKMDVRLSVLFTVVDFKRLVDTDVLTMQDIKELFEEENVLTLRKSKILLNELPLNDIGMLKDILEKELSTKISISKVLSINKAISGLLTPEREEQLQSCKKDLNEFIITKNFTVPVLIELLKHTVLSVEDIKELFEEENVLTLSESKILLNKLPLNDIGKLKDILEYELSTKISISKVLSINEAISGLLTPKKKEQLQSCKKELNEFIITKNFTVPVLIELLKHTVLSVEDLDEIFSVENLSDLETLFNNNKINGLHKSDIDFLMEMIEDNKEIKKSSGGRKVKPSHVKKQVCGKLRCIYKILGTRKEHLKYKGRLITVAEYKKIMKMKMKMKKKA